MPFIFDQASYVLLRASAASSSDAFGPLQDGPSFPMPGLKLFAYRWAPADGGGWVFDRVVLGGGGGKLDPALAHGLPRANPDAGRAWDAKPLPKVPPTPLERPRSYFDRCSGSVRTSCAD